jgi:hypothetical protein
MTRLVVDKHDIDPSTLKSTIPLLVIKDIPALLAAAVEQALIVSRRKGIAKNKDNPYQKKIEEVSSKDLRHFAAKVRFLIPENLNKNITLGFGLSTQEEGAD